MTDFAEMEEKNYEVSKSLCDKASELERALIMNDVQYQRGESGYQTHQKQAEEAMMEVQSLTTRTFNSFFVVSRRDCCELFSSM
jgi:hypothetical protein